MRIALHHVGEVGFRAGRILLGDRRVERLGLVGKDPLDSHGGRVERAGEWSNYDLLVTDAESPTWVAEQSAAAGISCVLWIEHELAGLPVGEDSVLLAGGNLASGIAPCLASHEVARAASVTEITVAWTEPGKPLRSGEPLAFPDPVGGRWGRKVEAHGFAAPVSGEWAAAMAQVTSTDRDDAVTRIVGVADLAPHLEGIALAAAGLAVGDHAYAPGRRTPPDAAEAFLSEALRLGLDVAAYTIRDD